MSYEKELNELRESLSYNGMFEELSDSDTRIYDGIMEIDNDVIHCQIVSPHDGTGNRWLVRATPSASFDRWANSTAFQGYFDTFELMKNYLTSSACVAHILSDVLESLSADFKELNEYSETMEYGIEGFSRGPTKGVLV